jgi:hypothetical protein
LYRKDLPLYDIRDACASTKRKQKQRGAMLVQGKEVNPSLQKNKTHQQQVMLLLWEVPLGMPLGFIQ